MVLRQRFAQSSVTSVFTCLSAILLMGLSGCAQETTDKDIEYISGAELQVSLAKANDSGESDAILLIDPRPAAEYEAGHLPNAWNKALSTIPTGQKPDGRIEAFDKIVVYGNNPGTPSAIGMTKRLLQNGYSDVYFYADGLQGWIAQGGSVETGRSKRWPVDKATVND